MTQNQLQYFVTVREYMNFSRAAEKLYVTQPAVSRQIAALEEELGARLFDRDGRNLSLTPAGKVFAEGAGGILSLMETTAQKVKDVSQKENAVFVLGHPRPDSDCLFFQALAALEEKIPDISFQLRFAKPIILMDELSSGNLDALIAPAYSWRPVQENGCHFAALYRDQCYCIFSSSSPLAGRPSVSLDDLNDTILYIWGPRSNVLDPPVIGAIRANSSAYRTQYIERPEEALAMVTLGRGATFSFGKNCNLPSGLSQVPLCDAPPIEFFLVWRKGSFPDNFDTVIRFITDFYHAKTGSESAAPYPT